MSESLPTTNRTIVLVDVASFTHPDRRMPHQTAVREGLYKALEEAFTEAHVDWNSCYHEDRGDGVMILVPSEVSVVALADPLLDRLVAALREHNAIHVPEASIRLRLLLHFGQVRLDSSGASGLALNAAFRLLESSDAKRELKDSGAILAVIASADFYRDVVLQHPAAVPEEYQPIHVDHKEFAGDAWLRLLGMPHKPTGPREVLGQFTDDEMDLVRGWLADVDVPNFNDLARRAGRAALPLPQFDSPWHAFVHLADLNAGQDAVPPALVFLDAFAAEAGIDKDGPMIAWIEEQIRRLGIGTAFQEHRRGMAYVVDEPRLHLLVALERDGISSRRYVLSVWRQDDPDVWPPPRTDVRYVEIDQIERIFDDVVVSAERAWADQRATVTLEVLLPRELIQLPVHSWEKEHESGQPQPLCLDYIIRVRSLDRLKATHWHRAWRERWLSMRADPSPARIHFARADATPRVDVALRMDNAVAMVLTGPPPPQPEADLDEYIAAMRSGLPIVIWHPDATPEELQSYLTDLISPGTLIDLPERTKKSRMSALGPAPDSNLARDLVVLWDDPDRMVVLACPPS